MPEYVCIRKCWHNDVLHRPGKRVFFAEEPPDHFMSLDEHNAEIAAKRESEADAKVNTSIKDMEAKLNEIKRQNAQLKGQVTKLKKKIEVEDD